MYSQPVCLSSRVGGAHKICVGRDVSTKGDLIIRVCLNLRIEVGVSSLKLDLYIHVLKKGVIPVWKWLVNF